MNRQQILHEQAALTKKLKEITPREITPREYVSQMTRLRSELSIAEKQICDDYDRVVLENSSLKSENSTLKSENSSLKSENSTLKSENSTLKSEIYKLQKQCKLKEQYNSVGKPWICIEDSQLINEYNSGMNILEISKNHKRNIGGIRSRLRKLNCKDTGQQRDELSVKELYQDVNEIKSHIRELKEMFNALYEFETR